VGRLNSNLFGTLISESGWVGLLSGQPVVGRAVLPILRTLRFMIAFELYILFDTFLFQC